MTFETIKYETQGATAIITFIRPQVFNALNKTGKLEIIQAVGMANADDSVRSIIMTGEGKAFCSGQDLNDRTVDARQGPVDIGHTLETEWNPLVEAIRGSEKLVVAAINGVCAGAGLSVALACDLKVALPGTRFIAGFTQIGLAPDAGLSYQLVRAMGYSRALNYALRGKPLMSEDMVQLGLINEVHEAPLSRATELTQELNRLAPLSLKHTKKTFLSAQEVDWKTNLETEKVAQRFLGFSQDYREGVTAFMEKRPPIFKGE